MNYSTLKKTVALSFASLMVVGMASAQTDSTKTGTAKVFGGVGQYNTFSIGIDAGITSGLVPFANNASSKFNPALGYGVSLRNQFSHTFSLQLDYFGGKVEGKNETGKASKYGFASYKTKFNSGALSAVFDIASVSFLHRKNSVNFYGSAGLGLTNFKVSNTTDGGVVNNGDFSNKATTELFAPVGLGVKFKLSDALALKLGYTVNFIQSYNFEGEKTYPQASHYSYTYGGLEYTFGPKSKQNIEWVNPVATLYDELYDAALRQEVEALKGRVTNVETAVSDLKKDSDGDGVADQFDKCPGTAAGSVVDGSGCVIVFPKVDTLVGPKTVGTPYSNIQFEFDSSVLRTSSYPVLDATSADLRASGKGVEVDGFASSEGTAAHNIALSKDRANSVKTYLVNSGVDAKKVKVKGLGETMPIADNSTEEGRVLNRRVQFKQK